MRRIKEPSPLRSKKSGWWQAWLRRRLCHCRLGVRHSVLVVALSLLGLTGARAAAAAPVDLRIEMYGVGGLHVATNRTMEEESGNWYAIVTDVESLGIVSLLVDVRSHSEVHGRLSSDSAHTEAYFGEVYRNGADSYNRVDYAADGTVRSAARPPSQTPLPVTPELMRGTVDQLSALFMVERQLTHRGSCTLVIAVFDGRRRYDLHFWDGSPEVLAAKQPGSFAGPTQVCYLRREAIAGFSDRSGRSEGAYEGTIWYARLLPDALVVPVQMEFHTEFGTISARLAELDGHGANIRFTE
jgi:hypothetical protein